MKLVKNWKELSEVPDSDTHSLRITPEDGNGWIVEVGAEDVDTASYSEYLSTHTFYGKTYQYSTKLLQKHGFNVKLANWDK